MGHMPATREDLLDHLQSLGIETTTVEHPPLFTVEQSQALRGKIPGAHTKNLFLKCKKGTIWLIVALEDAEINLKTVHKIIGSGRLSFGRAELLEEVLGVLPGSVTPFSLINDKEHRVCVVLDAPMMEQEVLNFHPLENTATTTISREGFLDFVRDCGHDAKILNVSTDAA